MQFDQIEEEPKDYTKLFWLATIAIFVLAVVGLWILSHHGPDISMVHAKHILIKFNAADPVDRARALELINSLRDRIMKGERFSKIAKEYSNDEHSSPRGGDLGFQRRGVYEPTFEEYVWSAPVDELSPVIQTSYGFHLITVTSRHISSSEEYEQQLEQKAIEAGATEDKQTKPE